MSSVSADRDTKRLGSSGASSHARFMLRVMCASVRDVSLSLCKAKSPSSPSYFGNLSDPKIPPAPVRCLITSRIKSPTYRSKMMEYRSKRQRHSSIDNQVLCKCTSMRGRRWFKSLTTTRGNTHHVLPTVHRFDVSTVPKVLGQARLTSGGFPLSEDHWNP